MLGDVLSVLSLVFGFLAVVFGLLSYQFNKHSTIMVFMILLSVMWSLHYATLGLFTPVVMNAIHVVRNLVYAKREKLKLGAATPYLFAAVSIAFGIVTYQSPASLLPMLGAALTAFSTWQIKAKNLRILSVPVQACWFAYDIINASIPGIVNDILTFGSIFSAMVRHDYQKLRIRKATNKDLPEIAQIYKGAREFMAENGNPNQWAARNYPSQSVTEADIASGKLFVCTQGSVLGVFFYDFGERVEPTYNQIKGAWVSGETYGVVHRIAVKRGTSGVGTFCLNWAFEQCGHLRIDTHRDNKPMQNLLKKLGFAECGIINLANGDERIAYEKANP